MPNDYLAIYLNDHLMGATIGLELAKRIAGRDDELAAAIAPLVDEIDEDRRRLLELMVRLDVRCDRLKMLAGWTGEKVGRLKLNGHLFSRSPLSAIEELEALLLGVDGKTALWTALRASTDPRIDREALAELHKRAKSQRRRIERLRLRAVSEIWDNESPQAQ